MDRKLFLSCQSFLYPISSSSLSNNSTSTCCREVLLESANLSIEPCENTRFCTETSNKSETDGKTAAEGKNTGPAYFLPQKATTRNASVDTKICRTGGTDSSAMVNIGSGDKLLRGYDPAVCEVDLILYTTKLPVKGMTTPVKKTNRRDLTEIDDQEGRNDEAILVLNINGDHFQIDLNRILGTRLGKSEDELSSFWILQMPSCYFRFYISKPQATEDSSAFGIGDSPQRVGGYKVKFGAVQDKLGTLLSGDFLLPFPLSYSGQIIPSGQTIEHSDSEKLPGKQNKHYTLACSRRCLQSYSQSWNNLIMFDNALENPYSVESSGCAKGQSFKETANALMSKIPKQVLLSYIDEDNLTKALEIHESIIATKIHEFESVIEDFWNEESEINSNNKRRRDDKDSDNCSQDDCPKRFADILSDHKKSIASKHELFLLPLRG